MIGRHLTAGALVVVVAMAAGCSAGAPILANPPAQRPSAPVPTPPPVAIADPIAVELPGDDGAHDRLTEWWYYTGHLRSADGHRFGFEYVIFRAERGAFPTTWASHLAITDETAGTFHYGQRLEVGEVDRSRGGPDGRPADRAGGRAGGFDLGVTGIDPTDPATFERTGWTMTGSAGTDRLEASLSRDEAVAAGIPQGMRLQLDLEAQRPRPCTTAMAGSTSGRPAAPITTRARPWRQRARSMSTAKRMT